MINQTAPTRAVDGTAYELSGPVGTPVVVLIHGLGLNRHLWQEFETTLLPHYRVLKYDLLGHGDSLPPPAKLSLTVFVAQLSALLAELNIETCTLAGFSLGGMINRRFAVAYPQRVAALAIFNSPHKRSRTVQQLAETRTAQTAKQGIAPSLDSTIARWFTPEFRVARHDYIAHMRSCLLANDPLIYAQCHHVLITGVTELIAPQPPITCPTLVMTCENDQGSTPAMAHAIAAEIRSAQMRIVPDLQHMGLVEQPQKFTTVLRQFLRQAIQ